MSTFITVGVAIFMVVAIYYMFTTRNIKDLDRLQEINNEIKKEFHDYKIQAFNLSEHLSQYVEERNVMINECIRVISLQLDQLKDNQDFLNSMIIDDFINDLNISMKKNESGTDYQAAILFLKTVRNQTDTINDRIRSEVEMIKRLLERSNNHVFNNIASMLFKNRPYRGE